MAWIKKRQRTEDILQRRLRGMDQRQLHNLAEGTVGQLSIAILGMVQGQTEMYDHNLWEAQKLAKELSGVLDELDALA